MAIGIIDIEYALGTEVCMTEDYSRNQKLDSEIHDNLIRNASKTYYSARNEDVFALGKKSINAIISRNNIDPKSIAYVIYCHTSQANILPPPFSVVSHLQNCCQLHHASSFSISQQNCVSPIHAIKIVENLLQNKPNDKKAMIVTMDKILLEDLRRIGDSGIQSDGASVILLGKAETLNNQILGCYTYNDKNMIVGITEGRDYEENPNYLWHCTSVMRKSLKAAQIQPQELQTVCPQNTHRPSWEVLLSSMKIPMDRLHIQGLDQIGHALGSDVAINLKNSKSLFRKGHHLVFSSGIGGCFGAFVLAVNEVVKKG
ncbi:MAG: hypothetical protein HRU19_07150 [Pseudobacteriovorax sp.]|nr:hypothetical protein [Pseudobacteriovorax sp.]